MQFINSSKISPANLVLTVNVATMTEHKYDRVMIQQSSCEGDNKLGSYTNRNKPSLILKRTYQRVNTSEGKFIAQVTTLQAVCYGQMTR